MGENARFKLEEGKDLHPQGKIQHLDFTKDPGRFTTRPLPVYFTTKLAVVSPESKKRKSSEENSGSIHLYGRHGQKSGKSISTTAILWPVQAIFENRAATVEVNTLMSPVFWPKFSHFQQIQPFSAKIQPSSAIFSQIQPFSAKIQPSSAIFSQIQPFSA